MVLKVIESCALIMKKVYSFKFESDKWSKWDVINSCWGFWFYQNVYEKYLKFN